MTSLSLAIVETVMATDNNERKAAPPRTINNAPTAPRGVGSLARGGLTATRIPPSLQAKMAAVRPIYSSLPHRIAADLLIYR